MTQVMKNDVSCGINALKVFLDQVSKKDRVKGRTRHRVTLHRNEVHKVSYATRLKKIYPKDLLFVLFDTNA